MSCDLIGSSPVESSNGLTAHSHCHSSAPLGLDSKPEGAWICRPGVQGVFLFVGLLVYSRGRLYL